MSNKGNKYKVGVFAISSITLFVFAMVALGIMSNFKEKFPFITVVTSSVQGLEKGAIVKLKGVPIGKVSDMKIVAKNTQVLIVMEMDSNAVTSVLREKLKATGDSQEAFREYLKESVAKGMRCQLRYGGITGNLYLELALYDPEKFPPNKDIVLPEEHDPYIPSIQPVLIENIMGKMQEALEKIAAIDVNKIVENVHKTLAKIDATLDTINKQLKKADLPATSRSARAFLDDTKGSIAQVSLMRKSLEASLERASDLMASAKNLLDSLEKNPDSLIYGKSGNPVIKH
ncbi:MAG: MCE family protein [Kiritimatiellaeota bacterium]|nr:MCE family protein [Kiritimatiellota bacterium]